MQTNTDEPFFMLSARQKKIWETESKTTLSNREHLIKVLQAKLPIGLPNMDISRELQLLKSQLPKIKFTSYGDTNDMVQYAGVPFVEFATVEEYLNTSADRAFEFCRGLMMTKIMAWLTSHGFAVEVLPDNSGKNYHAGVIRKIQVAAKCYEHFDRNDCTVLHVDILERDGCKFKTDFQFPNAIGNLQCFQSSLNILVEDGGYAPDSLFVHELLYHPDQEQFFKGWKSDKDLVTDARFVEHRPIVGQPYLFSTHQHHDVRGGHQLSNRITFGVFLIYVPALNKIFLYS